MFSSSRERAIRICLTAIAASSLLALAGIVIFLFTEGLPLFRHVSPLDFLLGDLWYPTEDPGLFGIFPLLVGSVAVTGLSSLLAVPLGVMTAVYLAEIAPPFARRVIKPFVELLAALPTRARRTSWPWVTFPCSIKPAAPGRRSPSPSGGLCPVPRKGKGPVPV